MHGAAPIGDYVTRPESDDGQLSLLGEAATPHAVEVEPPQLTDFALYGAHPADEQTAALLHDWQDWIRDR